MTRPGNIPTEHVGIDSRIFRSRRGRLNHKANEAVENGKITMVERMKKMVEYMVMTMMDIMRMMKTLISSHSSSHTIRYK